MKKLVSNSFVVLLFLSSCQKQKPVTAEDAVSTLPPSWVVKSGSDSEDGEWLLPSAKVSEGLNATFASESEALESAEKILSESETEFARTEYSNRREAAAERPKDWAPWHREYFMTDLAVSVSGWIGTLVNKGTPSVIVVWRKQYPKPTPTPAGLLAETITADKAAVQESAVTDSSEFPTLNVTRETTDREIELQLEPAILAAVASKRVKDVVGLRGNLVNAAREFREMTSQLEESRIGEWWVSRYRQDLSIEASGKVTSAIDGAAELRLRLEWHRLKKIAAPVPAPTPATTPALSPVRVANTNLSKQLLDFANAMTDDLEEFTAPDADDVPSKFKAYSFRVGLAVSKAGNLGVAKLSTTLAGTLFFNRDVKKPAPNPRPTTAVADADGVPVLARNLSSSSISGSEDLLLVGRDPDARTLFGSREDWLSISRHQFRKGMKKAIRMGGYFGVYAGENRSGKWKVYELRTILDISWKGKAGLASLSGVAMIEIDFYNTQF